MTYTIYMNPVAKGRPRTTMKNGYAKTYTPKKTRDAEEYMSLMVRSFGITPFAADAAIRLIVAFFLPRPKSAKKRVYPIVKPDIDNLLKSLCDSLSGVLRDQQIVEVHAKKLYTISEPRIDFSLEVI